MFRNPILTGFNPDPSICRVDDEYYIVTSTFEYFPGLPIYKSTDLVTWEQIGNVLEEPEQLNLDGARSSAGLYAPSIRYNNGTYYVVCTNVTNGGNFVVTAKNPAGPWSRPHFLNTDGIDPSLFFDDDKKAYYIGQRQKKNSGYNGDCEVYIQEFDTDKLQVVGEPVVLWDGALKKAFWVEGPRLYKMFGYYYLLVAEGGTRDYHSVTMARSKNVFGVYEPCMRNPILTHRHLGSDFPIYNVGHADLVETQNNEWWMVALGCRGIEGHHCNLGRETFLAKVDWDDDLWPVVNKGMGYIPESSQISPKLTLGTAPESPLYETFDGDKLPCHWITARTPRSKFYSMNSPGLRLYTQKTCADDTEHFSFLGKRVRHKAFTAQTAVELKNVCGNERAGIVIIQKNTHYIEVTVGAGEIVLTIVDNGEKTVIKKECNPGKIYITTEVKGQNYSFYYGCSKEEKNVLAKQVDGRILSTEYATSYAGLVIGMMASSYGEDSLAYADFEYFYYCGADEEKTDCM